MGNIKEICNKIRASYIEEKEGLEKANYYQLGSKFGYYLASENNKISYEELKESLMLIRKVSEKEKNISHKLEKKILSGLEYYVMNHMESFDLENKSLLNEDLIKNEKNNKLNKAHKISLELKKISEYLLEIKKVRDSFSGKRKGCATLILGYLSEKYKIEELEKTFESNLKLKGAEILENTLESMIMYYEENEKSISPKLKELIYKKIKKSKSRNEIVTCLNSLIKLGNISELEALSELDKWKEENYY